MNIRETLAADNRQIPGMTNGQAWGYFGVWAGLGALIGGCAYHLYDVMTTADMTSERADEDENGNLIIRRVTQHSQVYKPVRIPALKGTLYVRKWIWCP